MHSKHTGRALVLGLLLGTLTACGQQQAAKDAATYREAPAGNAAPAAPASALEMDSAKSASVAVATNEATPAAQLASSAATYTDAQRKFIRTAHAEFRVRDVYQSAMTIEDIVAAQGGFVVRNDIGAQTQNVQRRSNGDGRLTELAEYALRGELVVRVPSDKTQAFLRAIVGQIDFLDHRTFEANDAQFDMLRQQLAWQRGQEAQQELGQAAQQGGKLDQKGEVIGARNQARTGRDEALVAQKEFEDKVAFSTIDLSIYQSSRIRQTELIDVEAEFRKDSPGFFTRLSNSMRVGWYGLLDVFVELSRVWPLWLLIAVVVLAVRGLRRKQPPTD